MQSSHSSPCSNQSRPTERQWLHGIVATLSRMYAWVQSSSKAGFITDGWILRPLDGLLASHSANNSMRRALPQLPSRQYVILQDSYDAAQDDIPEVPEHLKRIVGLAIGNKFHPAMILDKDMLDTFEWTCHASRKAKRVVNHLREEIGRLDAQDHRQHAENRRRQREMQALRATIEVCEDPDLIASYEDAIDGLQKTLEDVEEQRGKWAELREEMTETCVNEGLVHGSRMMKASIMLEGYLERSGRLKFDAKAYLEESRAAAPALRDYYHDIRAWTQRYQQNKHANMMDDIDADNCTGTGDLARGSIPSHFDGLLAEYCYWKQELHVARQEFDDRAAWKKDHMWRWEALGAGGADRPSRSEADRECLMEDRRKAQSIQRAEDAVADLRSQLREYVAVSDVDSYVPEHETPIKGVRHTAMVRDAIADDRLLKWCDNLSSRTFGPPPSTYSKSPGLSDSELVLVEDAYSMSEKNSFIASRKRGWEKIQASRQAENDARFGALPNGNSSDRSLGRGRRRSTTSTSSYSGHSNKRHRPCG